MRTRVRSAAREAALHDQIIALKAEIDATGTLLHSEPQVLVAWAAAGDQAEILGDPSLVAPASAPHRVLAFGTWLAPEQSMALDHAVDALRSRGEGFAMTLTTLAGHSIEASGRAIGGRAVLRLRDITGIRRELNELAGRHAALTAEVESLRALVDALPAPAWTRDAAGKLAFVNAAYARAVESDVVDTVAHGLEFLDRAARDDITRARVAQNSYAGRLSAVVAGQRRSFDVIEMPTHRGSVGVAIDASEAESMRAELARMIEAHRRTLDQLATGVAIFTADHRLSFYNTGYRALWDLDAAFLDDGPTDAEVLARLRAARKLPEQQDFREWKAQLHEAYRAVEAKEALWHLPDGRTLRAVTTPNPEGGVTYLFDDVTERLELARRYDALISVQRETLDNLSEAVAVFGSDGRIRLFNPHFARMWKLPTAALAERPHIETVSEWCKPLHHDDPVWSAMRSAVTAIDEREPVTGRIECRDGSVVDCTTVPLPDGATLVAFQDVTDSVNVERALRERNEALEAADAIKINFVHHMSYELRSPLTNIIGFAHFLGDPATGPITEKQREYLGYINTSTNALLAIINNILDLATIDAGAMTLNLGLVDIRRTMEAAAEGIRDRLEKDGIRLDIVATPDIGSFTADERRVRQILFNLLANAVSFSPPGTTVTLAAERRRDAVVFRVTDRGPGIPPVMQDRVFDRFETHPLGSQHRGTGLGLSLVRSFVELHGGTVTLESAVGAGTTVTCTFPLEHVPLRSAA
jgi:signal transduction histidine kinase